MFSSLSDAALSTLRWWVSWVAAGGSGLGVFCAVLTILTTRETSRRSSTKTTELEETLIQTRADLLLAEAGAKDAQETARLAHAASQPRTLTPDQRAKLVAAFKGGPKGKIIVKADLGDGEAETYAGQIQNAILEAGAEVVEQGYTGIVTLHHQGGAILIKNPALPPPHTAFVQECLLQIGLKYIPGNAKGAEFPDDALIIWISHK